MATYTTDELEALRRALVTGERRVVGRIPRLALAIEKEIRMLDER